MKLQPLLYLPVGRTLIEHAYPMLRCTAYTVSPVHLLQVRVLGSGLMAGLHTLTMKRTQYYTTPLLSCFQCVFCRGWCGVLDTPRGLVSRAMYLMHVRVCSDFLRQAQSHN